MWQLFARNLRVSLSSEHFSFIFPVEWWNLGPRPSPAHSSIAEVVWQQRFGSVMQNFHLEKWKPLPWTQIYCAWEGCWMQKCELWKAQEESGHALLQCHWVQTAFWRDGLILTSTSHSHFFPCASSNSGLLVVQGVEVAKKFTLLEINEIIFCLMWRNCMGRVKYPVSVRGTRGWTSSAVSWTCLFSNLMYAFYGGRGYQVQIYWVLILYSF